MAGAELVVGVASDSNNSARKLFSALGGRITFDGAGCGLGQKIGVARGEVVAQAESARAQVSHNSISDGRGRSAIFFMLRSDGGHGFGLGVLGRAGLVDLLRYRGADASLLSELCAFGTVATPGPTCPEGQGQCCGNEQGVKTDHHGISGGITAPTWRMADSSDITRSLSR